MQRGLSSMVADPQFATNKFFGRARHLSLACCRWGILACNPKKNPWVVGVKVFGKIKVTLS
jgi:hypothetical protein